MTLEAVVRPFVSREPLRSQRIITSSKKAAVPQTSVVTWGAAGTLPSPVESDADQPAIPISVTTQTKKVTDKNVEKSRETEKVRIENPDDPAQYVMVDRPKKVTFNKVDPVTMQAASNVTTGYTSYPSTSTAKTPTAQNSVQTTAAEFTLKPPA